MSGSFEENVSIRFLQQHIEEIEKKKKLNEELKKERRMRKKAETEIFNLRRELK